MIKKNLLVFDIATYIFTFVFVIVFLFLLWQTYQDQTLARHALREAKNVQLSIRLVSTEYYGQNTTPISSATASGLKKDAEEEVLKMAEADGEIEILQWDSSYFVPTAFEYKTGSFLVTYYEEDGESHWEVSKLKLLIQHP